MWSKISHAIYKPANKQAHDDPEPSGSQGDVMSSVFEQHPNLSVFHGGAEPPSPPSSPSKRRGMFKRMAKGHREDSEPRPASPMKLPIGLPKKVKSTLSVHGNSKSFFLSRFILLVD